MQRTEQQLLLSSYRSTKPAHKHNCFSPTNPILALPFIIYLIQFSFNIIFKDAELINVNQSDANQDEKLLMEQLLVPRLAPGNLQSMIFVSYL